MVESHIVVGEAVGKAIHERFLNEVFTLEALRNTINITILTKCFRSATSTIFNNGKLIHVSFISGRFPLVLKITQKYTCTLNIGIVFTNFCRYI
jgi:hypothetical protein